MSNVIPQRPNLNRGPWKSFEDLCRKVVASGPITKLWMISGPVFENDKPDEMIANGVWVPHGTYKIMAWNDSEGQFQARALVYPQDARDDNHRLYLVSIAELETMTHLCFFPELPKDQVERIKQTKHDQLWK